MVDEMCKEMQSMLFPQDIQISFGSSKNKEDDVVNGRWDPYEFPMALVKWKHTPKLGNKFYTMVFKGGL